MIKSNLSYRELGSLGWLCQLKCVHFVNFCSFELVSALSSKSRERADYGNWVKKIDTKATDIG